MIQVSVIIPVFNIEAHLQQCLDSVINQTLSDIEIICVDDGSTDTSPQILSKYAERDKRFRIITQENSGPGIARNTGLDQAKGKYVIFLDSDDWFELDFLEQVVKQAEATKADVIICRAVEFDTESNLELRSDWMLDTSRLPSNLIFSPKGIASNLFCFTWGWPWDKLYRRKYLEMGRFYYPNLKNSEDLAFVFLSLAAAERLSIVNTVLVHHRVNRKDSVSNSRENCPEAPYEAIKLLEANLKQRGLYDCYEQAFLNWAMGFLIWNTASMKDRNVQKKCFSSLKQIWLPSFPFQDHPVSYYNLFTYIKFLTVKFLPCIVFYQVVNVYYTLKNFWRLLAIKYME